MTCWGTGEEREGAKTTIFRVLESAEAPLTTAQIWNELEVRWLLGFIKVPMLLTLHYYS